jgi:hypothetical protein
MLNLYKIMTLIFAIFIVYGLAIPFIMSDQADELILYYGLDQLALRLLGR